MGIRFLSLARSLTRKMSTNNSPDAYLLFPTSKHPNISADKLWASARPKNKVGEAKLFYNQVQGNPEALTALVSLGDGFDNKAENDKREAVRRAVGNGIRQLRDAGATTVAVDDSVDPHAAGVYLYPGLVPEFEHRVQLWQPRLACTNSRPCAPRPRTRTLMSQCSRLAMLRLRPSLDGIRVYCMVRVRTLHER